MSNYLSLYIHIPFCKSKCPYCDFFSGIGNEEKYDDYRNALIEKIDYWSSKTDKSIETIYFGGGTPSVIGAKRLTDILSAIKNKFAVSKNAEITVEINPDTGKIIDFSKLKQCGFNRISVGLQSACENELKALGRIHNTDDVKLTVQRAKNAGLKNISLDLMMGIPFQSKESLRESIDFCSACGVNHISSYILKIEQGTKFFEQKDNLILPNEDIQADLYLFATEYLEKLGYRQYEISNFAKVGFESKHNVNYWKCGEYIGIGPSAHSFFNGKRFYYDRSMEDFKNNVIISDGTGGSEEEFIMLSLRLKSGLNFNEYRDKFGKLLPSRFSEDIKKYVKAGFMTVDDEKICFTPKGFLVSNSIIADLI